MLNVQNLIIFLCLPSDPLSLPGTPLCRDAHPLPPENIFSLSVRPPAVPAFRLASLPLRPRHPYGARSRPPFQYVVSPYHPQTNPTNRRYRVAPATWASITVIEVAVISMHRTNLLKYDIYDINIY